MSSDRVALLVTPRDCQKLVAAWRVLWPSAPWRAEDMPLTVTAWALVLADVTYQEAEAAMIGYARSGAAFPPAPGQLAERALDERSRLNGTRPPDLDLALSEVRFYVENRASRRGQPPPEWSHPAVAEAVRAIGWPDLCEGGDTVRAHFRAAYESARSRHLGQPVKRTELANPRHTDALQSPL